MANRLASAQSAVKPKACAFRQLSDQGKGQVDLITITCRNIGRNLVKCRFIGSAADQGGKGGKLNLF